MKKRTVSAAEMSHRVEKVQRESFINVYTLGFRA
jgi:hypothetical protein